MDRSIDFSRFDKILEDVQAVFMDIAQAHGIDGSQIERWHWDEPRITLTWRGNDGIGRNISGFVNEEDGQPSDVELEINAWMDRGEEKGEVRMRKWRHEIVRRLPLSLGPPVQELAEACGKAYQLVSGWSLADLTSETKITSAATA